MGKLSLGAEVLYYIIDPDALDNDEITAEKRDNIKNRVKDYIIVENEITSHDEYDGGTFRNLVIQNVETKKFYQTSYNDWDMGRQDSWGNVYDLFTMDLNGDLIEVEEHTKTIKYYK